MASGVPRVSWSSSTSGVSSLTALRGCEADVLKLDGTIARMLGSSGDDDPIVRAIIQLAHALDMQVVAEWVTSADQLRRLSDQITSIRNITTKFRPVPSPECPNFRPVIKDAIIDMIVEEGIRFVTTSAGSPT